MPYQAMGILMPCEVIGRLMPKFLYFKYALWAYGYAQLFILQICHMDRLMPKFLYFKYAVWADLCSIFYTSNMPYGQTYGYAQILILQICHLGRLMPKFLYFKYAFWADLCPNFYTSNKYAL